MQRDSENTHYMALRRDAFLRDRSSHKSALGSVSSTLCIYAAISRLRAKLPHSVISRLGSDATTPGIVDSLYLSKDYG